MTTKMKKLPKKNLELTRQTNPSTLGSGPSMWNTALVLNSMGDFACRNCQVDELWLLPKHNPTSMTLFSLEILLAYATSIMSFVEPWNHAKCLLATCSKPKSEQSRAGPYVKLQLRNLNGISLHEPLPMMLQPPNLGLPSTPAATRCGISQTA